MEDEPITEFQSLSPYYFKIALFTQLLNPVHSLIHTQEFKEGFVTHSFSDVAQNLFKILLHLLARMEQDFESFSQDSVFLFD